MGETESKAVVEKHTIGLFWAALRSDKGNCRQKDEKNDRSDTIVESMRTLTRRLHASIPPMLSWWF